MTTPRSAAAATVRSMVRGSPAWKPQATLALVTTSSRARSSPRLQTPYPSPRSLLRSTLALTEPILSRAGAEGLICSRLRTLPPVLRLRRGRRMAVPGSGQLGEALVDLDALEMLTSSRSYADAVRQLLVVVRTQLDMQVAWVSEFVGAEQVLRYVDAEHGLPHAPAEGTRAPLSGSFCARVLDGRFPALIPDARAVPEAALLDVTAELHIGSYIGVPVLGPHGVAVGMLCAINDHAAPSLSERDVAALRLMVQLLGDL